MEDQTKNEGKTPKRNYISLNEWIAKMKTAFANAKQPVIFEALQTVGYTESRLNELFDELTELETLCEVQRMEQAEQNAETQRFNEKREVIHGLFLMHRNIAKILFKKDLQAQVALNLNMPVKTAYADWLRLTSNFYAQLSKSEALKTEAAKVGITTAVITTALESLDELTASKDAQKKEIAEAQSATEKRDQAFDSLYEKYTELMSYAKVLLKGNQALEALGVVVKR